MLDLRQLETFRLVAVTGNFNRAANQLGCAQSTVTGHIQSLERELGARLFERHRFSRTVSLTEVGRRTFEYAVRLLALAAEAKAQAVSLTGRFPRSFGRASKTKDVSRPAGPRGTRG
jgi:DNA-binding transcriptional LysR family regulator